MLVWACLCVWLADAVWLVVACVWEGFACRPGWVGFWFGFSLGWCFGGLFRIDWWVVCELGFYSFLRGWYNIRNLGCLPLLLWWGVDLLAVFCGVC